MAISRTDKTVLIGECKWSQNPIGINVLTDLKQKSQIALRTIEISTIYYALFSRNGFSSELERVAKKEGVSLYTVDMLVEGL